VEQKLEMQQMLMDSKKREMEEKERIRI